MLGVRDLRELVPPSHAEERAELEAELDEGAREFETGASVDKREFLAQLQANGRDGMRRSRLRDAGCGATYGPRRRLRPKLHYLVAHAQYARAVVD